VNQAAAEIGTHMVAAAKNVSSSAPLTPADAVEKLRALYGRSGGAFDWAQLGRDASVFFREAPCAHGTYHLLGMFETVVVRKVVERVAKEGREKRGKDEHVEITRPDDVVEVEKREGQNATRKGELKSVLLEILEAGKARLASSAAAASSPEAAALAHLPKGVREAAAALVRRVRPQSSKKEDEVVAMIDLTRALFDPWSYALTVENLFYASFSVKDGLLAVVMGREAGVADAPVLPYLVPLTEVSSTLTSERGFKLERRPPAQFAFEIDHESWRAITRSLRIERPLLPHFKRADCRCPPGTPHAAEAEGAKGAKGEKGAKGAKRRAEEEGAEDEEAAAETEDEDDGDEGDAKGRGAGARKRKR